MQLLVAHDLLSAQHETRQPVRVTDDRVLIGALRILAIRDPRDHVIGERTGVDRVRDSRKRDCQRGIALLGIDDGRFSLDPVGLSGEAGAFVVDADRRRVDQRVGGVCLLYTSDAADE